MKPILAAALLREVDGQLLELLRGLTAEEWERPTIAGQWRVRDVAAHLLDTALRKLSLVRDGFRPPIEPFPDLAALINRRNAEGVALYGRLSGPVLLALLDVACRESAAFHESLDPFAPAAFPVSWAGESESLNWFDTARELTERWHHQQQIRLAAGRPGIETPRWYFPVLDCFLRVLPHAYRHVAAEPGDLVRFTISGECGGCWFLYRDDAGWRLLPEAAGREVAHVTIPQAIAWRVFTKGIARPEAMRQITVTGSQAIGWHVLEAVAIVA